MRELQIREVEYNFIFSGQHKDTIDDLRKNFGIKDPDVVLYSGRDVTGIIQMGIWVLRILFVGLFKRKLVWRGDKAGLVLNHGDTFSTLAGSLLARVCGKKNCHIESGLRSFNLLNPFPEELTRLVVFSVTQFYFCPNQWALNNLKGYSGQKILTNGNTLYDSLQLIKNSKPTVDLSIPKIPYAIVSFHRFENIFNKKNITRIFEILKYISSHIRLVVIGHAPTIKKLRDFDLLDSLQKSENIELRPRYDYANFIHLVLSSDFVVTDGGSNQEECYYLGKPCLLLRNATERTEGLNDNVVISNFDQAVVENFLQNYKSMQKSLISIDPSPTTIIVDYVSELDKVSR